MTLRRFRSDDLHAVVALFHDTVHRVNVRDYSSEQVAAWAPDEFDSCRWNSLGDRFTLVAESDREIVGFTDLEPDGHIDRFFVHADRQRTGVGRTMLAAILAESRRLGLDRVFCEASITARPFFENQGFAVIAEQHVEVRGVRFLNYRMERRLDGV